MERQCCECNLPEFPEGTKITSALCQACTIKIYPEHPELHNVPDPDGTYYIQTGGRVNLKCPQCGATEKIFWYGDETSRCESCGKVDIDIMFVVENIQECDNED
jgi:hypothetical protein